jgi:hypothetical protein
LSTGNKTIATSAGQTAERRSGVIALSAFAVSAVSLAERFTLKSHDRHVPTPFDRLGQLALMSGTIAGDATGNNFAPLGHKPAQHAIIFVVYKRDLVFAKATDLLSAF